MKMSNSTTMNLSLGSPYLITGATGDVGARVVDLLMHHGQRPRVLVRDEQKARALFGHGVEVRVGDLENEDSLQAALQGMDGLFLVNIGPRIPVRDELAARVAKAAGVKHIVKLSSLDVEHGLAIGAWHEQGEAAIRASGVPFTFVQPTGFMSNLLAWAPGIKAEGIVRASTGDGRRAFIHSDDIAAVVLQTLTSRYYIGRALAITGPEALSFAEVTERIGAALGRPLRFQPISDDEARQRYAPVSGSGEETEAHVSLWRAIREGRLATLNDNVERILGRKPIGLDEWLSANVAAFQ
jgi:uncharacterized protein YbjT (DUF2867 family)